MPNRRCFKWTFAKVTVTLHKHSPNDLLKWMQKSPSGCKKAHDPTELVIRGPARNVCSK